MPDRAAQRTADAFRTSLASMPAPVAPHPILGHGQFYGDRETHLELDGVTLAELVPRVPEREVAMHTHPAAHFVLVLDGRYISTAAGAPPVSAAPTLVYNPPDTRHRDRFLSERGRFFTLSIDADLLSALAAYAPLPAAPVWIARPAARAAIARLRLECRRPEGASPLAVDGWVHELAASTAGMLHAEWRGRAPWLARTRDRLHDECGRPLRLRTLAADAGVHPGHLTRAFRQAFGCTPGEYVRLCRIERAARLLQSTRRSVGDIAADCGFSDQSHLTRALRRHVGLTPRRLRVAP